MIYTYGLQQTKWIWVFGGKKTINKQMKGKGLGEKNSVNRLDYFYLRGFQSSEKRRGLYPT